MRRHNNLLVYGTLLILSGMLSFAFVTYCFPLLSLNEIFDQHPFLLVGLPYSLAITGAVLIKIEFKRNKSDDDDDKYDE